MVNSKNICSVQYDIRFFFIIILDCGIILNKNIYAYFEVLSTGGACLAPTEAERRHKVQEKYALMPFMGQQITHNK